MAGILIIEDDKQVGLTLKSILERHGFNVSPAADCDSGTITFRKTPTDQVRTDMVIPCKNGMETISEL